MPDAPRSLQYMRPEDLPPDAQNPKTHDDQWIARSIVEHGIAEIQTLDERTGLLIAGHGRRDAYMALEAAGGEPPEGVVVDGDGRWLVPVLRGWASRDDAHAKAALIGLNRGPERGGFDEERLSQILAELAASDWQEGLDFAGYSSEEFDALLVSVNGYERHLPGEGAEDEIPESPAEPVTKRGDLWLLGPHRLLCGDATSEEDHAKVIGGGYTVDLVLTDPPYGVGVDYGGHMEDTPEAIAELVAAFMPLVLRHPRALITSGHKCMWDYPRPTWLLAWVHPAGSGANSWGFTCLNPVLAYGRDPYLAAGLGRRPDTLVLATDRAGVEGHPVVKPVAAWSWLVERGTTAEGQVVLDPFCGAGTTIIACESKGRVALGIELSPAFVDVSLARWQRLTGEKPVLESTGEPHSFLADA